MDKLTIQRTFDALKEVKGSCRFYDVHVHPFEVMFEPLCYHPSPTHKGVFRTGATEYTPPEIVEMDLHTGKRSAGREVDQKIKAKVALLNSRRRYVYAGSRVLADHMDLCLVDRSLLLPIVGAEEAGDGQLRLMREMYGGDDRFIFGYCVPNNIPNNKVADNVERVVAEYGVKTLKIHPAVTGINLEVAQGVDRVEAILDAAKISKLKVVIHGGQSPECKNRHAVSYGTLHNLQYVDWSITPETVVIAHSGCYGHSAVEVREHALPVMGRLLGTYPHLAVDTSGLGFETLCHVLKSIDPQRVLFGSDALYESQWSSMLRLWCALEQTSITPEDHLLRIASLNPARVFNVANGSALLTHGQPNPVFQTAECPAN